MLSTTQVRYLRAHCQNRAAEHRLAARDKLGTKWHNPHKAVCVAEALAWLRWARVYGIE